MRKKCLRPRVFPDACGGPFPINAIDPQSKNEHQKVSKAFETLSGLGFQFHLELTDPINRINSESDDEQQDHHSD